MNRVQHAVNSSNPYDYELIAEVTLKNNKSLNRIPRIYVVDLLIYMPQNQNIISYEVMEHDKKMPYKNETILLNLDPEEVTNKQVWGWKSYQFDVEKTKANCMTLTFELASITDPKPKIIFEDPIEIDPDSNT